MRDWQMQFAVFAIVIGGAIATSFEYRSLDDLDPSFIKSSHLSRRIWGDGLYDYQNGNEPKMNPLSMQKYEGWDENGHKSMHGKRTIVHQTKMGLLPVFSRKHNRETATKKYCSDKIFDISTKDSESGAGGNEGSQGGSKDLSRPLVSGVHPMKDLNWCREYINRLVLQGQSTGFKTSSDQDIQITPLYTHQYPGAWDQHQPMVHENVDYDSNDNAQHQQNHQQQSGDYPLAPLSSQYDTSEKMPHVNNGPQQQQNSDYYFMPALVLNQDDDEVSQTPDKKNHQDQSQDSEMKTVSTQDDVNEKVLDQSNEAQPQEDSDHQTMPASALNHNIDQVSQESDENQQHQNHGSQVDEESTQFDTTEKAPHQTNQPQEQEGSNHQAIPVSALSHNINKVSHQPTEYQQEKSWSYQRLPLSVQYSLPHKIDNFHQRSLFPYVFKIPMYIVPHSYQSHSNQHPTTFPEFPFAYNQPFASTQPLSQQQVPYFMNNCDRYHNQLSYYV